MSYSRHKPNRVNRFLRRSMLETVNEVAQGLWKSFYTNKVIEAKTIRFVNDDGDIFFASEDFTDAFIGGLISKIVVEDEQGYDLANKRLGDVLTSNDPRNMLRLEIAEIDGITYFDFNSATGIPTSFADAVDYLNKYPQERILRIGRDGRFTSRAARDAYNRMKSEVIKDKIERRYEEIMKSVTDSLQARMAEHKRAHEENRKIPGEGFISIMTDFFASEDGNELVLSQRLGFHEHRMHLKKAEEGDSSPCPCFQCRYDRKRALLH
jgi:hypothetical protein